LCAPAAAARLPTMDRGNGDSAGESTRRLPEERIVSEQALDVLAGYGLSHRCSGRAALVGGWIEPGRSPAISDPAVADDRFEAGQSGGARHQINNHAYHGLRSTWRWTCGTLRASTRGFGGLSPWTWHHSVHASWDDVAQRLSARSCRSCYPRLTQIRA
jgi:hypothetical protein